MQIDPRRDHSFRIPRPDVSVRLGTPNACNTCHEKRSAKWAADQVAKWYGPNRRQEETFADAAMEGQLMRLAADAHTPAILRATAIDRLSAYPSEAALDMLQSAVRDADPLVRMAAADAFTLYPPAQRSTVLPLMNDPVRAVRLAAVTSAPPERLNTNAIAEYERAQMENADQPGAHINIGNLRASLGRVAEAEAAYQTAIRLDRTFGPAYVNLADLKSRTGENAMAIAVLQAGLDAQRAEGPQTAALHHSMGLAMIRERRYDDAIAQLKTAAKQSPTDARYAYVLGVALYDTGKKEEGISTLERALRSHPTDQDLLVALAAYARDAGDTAAAAEYMKRMSGTAN
jgi:tetratricopeptide (TPR) repeat protein